MLLVVKEAMNRSNTEPALFFRLAHIWSFGTDPDTGNDVAQFLLHGVCPKYVQKYAEHIVEETT